MRYIHINEPLNPWWWRITQGFANLTDGIIAILTLGFITPTFGTRCALGNLKWGLNKLET
jgi:hypothetical protein